jgi:hypothetical protein
MGFNLSNIFASTTVNGNLKVLSLYEDLPASARARWATGAIARLAGPDWKTTPAMWKIDSLTFSEPIRETISSDAANADVIVIAISSLDQRAVDLFLWLDSLPARETKRSVPRLLIGLLGDDEEKSRELDWTVEQLMRCARQADRHFIWHWMSAGAMENSDWLTEGAGKHLAGLLVANDDRAVSRLAFTLGGCL